MSVEVRIGQVWQYLEGNKSRYRIESMGGENVALFNITRNKAGARKYGKRHFSDHRMWELVEDKVKVGQVWEYLVADEYSEPRYYRIDSIDEQGGTVKLWMENENTPGAHHYSVASLFKKDIWRLAQDVPEQSAEPPEQEIIEI
jgi:hypothetical protein